MFETAVYMPTDLTVNEITTVAMASEEAGFDYFLIPDEGLTRDVFVTLSSIALNTKKIKFGPAIVNPYTRHPVTSAVTVATLDDISGGRAFIGFGAGGSLVLGPLGVETLRPLQMCREAIEMTRGMFTGENINYEGKCFKLNNAKLQFDIRPDISIYLAGRGNKMLELGGELADGILLSGMAKSDLTRAKNFILRGAAKTQNFPKIFYDVHLAFNEEILNKVRADYSFMIIDSPEHIKLELEISDDKIEKMRELMITQSLQAAGELITTEMLSHFILVGDEAACAKELAGMMKTYDFDIYTLPVPPVEDTIDFVLRAGDISKKANQLL